MSIEEIEAEALKLDPKVKSIPKPGGHEPKAASDLLGRPRVTPPRRPNNALQPSVSRVTPLAGQPARHAARR